MPDGSKPTGTIGATRLMSGIWSERGMGPGRAGTRICVPLSRTGGPVVTTPADGADGADGATTPGEVAGGSTVGGRAARDAGCPDGKVLAPTWGPPSEGTAVGGSGPGVETGIGRLVGMLSMVLTASGTIGERATGLCVMVTAGVTVAELTGVPASGISRLGAGVSVTGAGGVATSGPTTGAAPVAFESPVARDVSADFGRTDAAGSRTSFAHWETAAPPRFAAGPVGMPGMPSSPPAATAATATIPTARAGRQLGRSTRSLPLACLGARLYQAAATD